MRKAALTKNAAPNVCFSLYFIYTHYTHNLSSNYTNLGDYLFLIAACAAASLAIGTLYGEHDT